MVISLAALVIVFSLLDFDEFKLAIEEADLRFLLAGILSELVWLAVRGFVWRTLLQNKATYKDVFITVSEGYLLNNILPFRLGELGRGFLLGRKAKLDFWQVIPSIVIERVLDLAIAAGMLLATLPFVIGVPWAKPAAITIGIFVVIGLGALFLIARNRNRVLAWIEKLGQRWSWVSKFATRHVASFFNGLAIITDGRLFLTALGWDALNWTVSILQYYLFLRAFIPVPSLMWVIFALGVGALGIAAPSSPGAIGVFEVAVVGALVAFGIAAEPATAFALSLHFSSYVITALIGGYGLYKDGESLSSMYTRLGRMKSEQGAKPQE